MKAAQLISPGRFEITDIPIPEPAAGQVLLKVAGAGMCRSDLHLVDHAPDVLPLPMTLGHETAARVADANGVAGIEVDEAFLVAGIWGCERCRPCRLGAVNACETWARHLPMPIGPGLGFAGGMAEYMVAPASALIPLGDLDPVQAAPLADAGITPAHAVSLVRDKLNADATVVVIGVGGLGHLALQILRATTACRIVAVDADAGVLEQAPRHGADVTLPSDGETAAKVMELTDGLGANVVIDFVGIDQTLAMASQCVRTYGAIVMTGLGQGDLKMRAGGVSRVDSPPWGVRVVRPYGATAADVFDVVALARDGKIAAEVELHPLVDAPDVLERLRAGEVNGRAVLTP